MCRGTLPTELHPQSSSFSVVNLSREKPEIMSVSLVKKVYSEQDGDGNGNFLAQVAHGQLIQIVIGPSLSLFLFVFHSSLER